MQSWDLSPGLPDTKVQARNHHVMLLLLSQDLRIGRATFRSHQAQPPTWWGSCPENLLQNTYPAQFECFQGWGAYSFLRRPVCGCPVLIAREFFFFFLNELKKSASFSSQQVPSRTTCIPLLQDRPCAPPALSVRGLSQIVGQRGGPKVVQQGWGAGEVAGIPGKRCTNVLSLSS